jgi:uncharacterized membrane protein (DUF485 family)
MDTFNYLAVMISIILGVGITQLFAGIGNLLQVRRRVNQYWLYNLWVFILIVAHVNLWWSIWALRESVTWTYPLYVFMLFGPAGLVISGHIIIPGEFYEEAADGKFDLRKHYYDASRMFFGIFAGVVIWAMMLEPVMGVRKFFVEFRLYQTLGLALVCSCAVSKNRILHTISALLTIVLLVGVIFLTRFRAGLFDFPK